jgi:two-component system sensor histidine kinase BaeS
MAAGVRRLASGEYAVAIPAGGDELGDLARDFNLLGRTLQRNEEARRDWIADISHELRTPLTVLRGEIEAMQDGLRPVSLEGVASLHAEVLSLGKLVDDLYELSLSDLGALDYRREPVSLAEIAVSAVETHRLRFEDKGVALTLGPMRPSVVYGDRRRLAQLLGNLLENSVRYTDPGGRCEVCLEANATSSVVTIDDSAPGVPAELNERLFERLYRVEGARTREHGGAGLGLAICRNIVEAHGGLIAALASPLGGLRIRLELPRERD